MEQTLERHGGPSLKGRFARYTGKVVLLGTLAGSVFGLPQPHQQEVHAAPVRHVAALADAGNRPSGHPDWCQVDLTYKGNVELERRVNTEHAFAPDPSNSSVYRDLGKTVIDEETIHYYASDGTKHDCRFDAPTNPSNSNQDADFGHGDVTLTMGQAAVFPERYAYPGHPPRYNVGHVEPWVNAQYFDPQTDRQTA